MRKDIDISFNRHPMTGDITLKTETSARVQSLKNLILTSAYERGFNLNPSTSITSYLFENMSDNDVMSLKSRIMEVVDIFEPEVKIKDVSLYTKNNTLFCNIYFFEVNNSEQQVYNLALG